MIDIVHSIYSQSVHALALNAGSIIYGQPRWAVLYDYFTTIGDLCDRGSVHLYGFLGISTHYTGLSR